MATLTRRAFLKVAALAAATAATAHAEPARDDSWQQEWDGLVAAATAEGRLSLITWGDTWGGPGFSGFRGVVARFQEAFPGIVVDHLPEASASVWLDTARRGRRADRYEFDLAIVPPGPSLQGGRPDGIWAPIRPLLSHPDVLNDAAWRAGLDGRYLDAAAQLCLSWEYQVLHAYAVNTDLVPDGAIRSVADLLDPTWTGKIVSSDPRLGIGLHSAAAVSRSAGTDVLRRLLVDQRPTVVGEARLLAEALVQGHYPVALGLRPKALAPFRDTGLVDKVRWLDLPDADFAVTTSLLYFDRAPHPAAARLFANWILTRDGQALLAGSLPTNSARLDVPPFEADGVGMPGAAYFEPDRESNAEHIAATQRLIRSIL